MAEKVETINVKDSINNTIKNDKKLSLFFVTILIVNFVLFFLRYKIYNIESDEDKLKFDHKLINWYLFAFLMNFIVLFFIRQPIVFGCALFNTIILFLFFIILNFPEYNLCYNYVMFTETYNNVVKYCENSCHLYKNDVMCEYIKLIKH